MKRVLVTEDIYTVGKMVSNLTLPIFTLNNLETVFVPQSLKASVYNPILLEDLSKNFDNLVKSFKNDMLHFDSIYYSLSKTSNLHSLASLIKETSFNDTKVICNATTFSSTNDYEIFNNANVVIVNGNTEEELISLSDKLSDKVSYIISYDVYVSDSKRTVIIFNKDKKESEYIYYKVWKENFTNLPHLFASLFTAYYLNENKVSDAVHLSLKEIAFRFSNLDSNYNFYSL